MTYEASYESEGNTALQVSGFPHREHADRIIPFPGNPRAAWGVPSERRSDRQREYQMQEAVTVESVPFGVEYIEARHLFYWMTDEVSPVLRAHHAPKMSPLKRKVYAVADRLRNAVEHHPFVSQLRYGTIDGVHEEQVTICEIAKMLVIGSAIAAAIALLGM